MNSVYQALSPPPHESLGTRIGSLPCARQQEVAPLPAIYRQELQKLATDANSEKLASRMLTFGSICLSLYRNRHKQLPPLHETRGDVMLQGCWRETLTGERFLLAKDEDVDKIIVYTSEESRESGLSELHGKV